MLNNLSAVAAGVGLILGVIALFGSRKMLAAIGVALCVAAIAFTVAAQSAAVDELERAFNGGTTGDTSATYRIGQTHKGEDANITVSKLRNVTTSETAMPEQDAKAFTVTVTVQNTSDEPLNPHLLTFAASVGDRPAQEVFDSGHGFEGAPGSKILPGRKLTFPVAFVRPGSGEIVVQVDSIGGDTVSFTKN